jgi:glycosyltransferase involved in cell wall biosynthesis
MIAGPKRRRYRIVHLITRLELGGAQQNTLFCVRHHDRSRFEVGLMAGEGGFLDAEALALPDAEVRLLPYLKHPISPVSDLLGLFKLRAKFREGGIDLVHTHSSKAGILGRVAAWLAGVPVVVHTVHGWSFNPTQPSWLRGLYVRLERLAAVCSTKLIVVSSHGRDTGLQAGIGRPEQYEIVHSGIDFDQYRRPETPREMVRRRLGFGPAHRVVGTMACLKHQKAPLDFVRAAAAAHARNPELRFFIAGDGELRPMVEKLVEELDLEDVIKLLGWREDVVDLLHAMDVFMLTSLFEGLPRAVLQAMAAGVPVVATAVDGTPEVVENGITGLLVPPARPDLAAERVLQIIEDDALRKRCVEGANRRLNEAFEINRMVRDLDKIYLELLEDGPSR